MDSNSCHRVGHAARSYIKYVHQQPTVRNRNYNQQYIPTETYRERIYVPHRQHYSNERTKDQHQQSSNREPNINHASFYRQDESRNRELNYNHVSSYRQDASSNRQSYQNNGPSYNHQSQQSSNRNEKRQNIPHKGIRAVTDDTKPPRKNRWNFHTHVGRHWSSNHLNKLRHITSNKTKESIFKIETSKGSINQCKQY